MPFWKNKYPAIDAASERLLRSVWNTTLGKKDIYWTAYSAYSQQELRHEIETQWHAWIAYQHSTDYPSVSTFLPWLWALKLYLWKYPLDTELAIALREEMGPLWMLHVRHNNDDWHWLYQNRKDMPRHALTPILGLLSPHPIGAALAVEIPPMVSYEEVYATEHDLICAEPAFGLLKNYGDVILHPESFFYPRWRALLLCAYYGTLTYKPPGKIKDPLPGILLDACDLLNLTPRTLWRGFDPSWVAHAKPLRITSLSVWDKEIKIFETPSPWTEQLKKQRSFA